MSFKALNLKDNTIASLYRQGYNTPTASQTKVISALLRGESMLFKSPTGSGKTHAYLIPLIDKIDCSSEQLQAIIVSPTRELNRQIYSFAEAFKKEFPQLEVCLFDDKNKRLTFKGNSSQIVIATAKNILEYLDAINFKSDEQIAWLILDEADLLFDEDHLPNTLALLNKVKSKQLVASSASMKNDLENQLKKFATNKLSVIQTKNFATNIKHVALDIKHRDVIEALIATIAITNPYLAIIFSSKKEKCKAINDELIKAGYNSTLLTSDLGKRERKNIFATIKHDDEISLVVASDLFARGIDLPNCDLVINIDLPSKDEYYLHRAGRAGRFGKAGTVITFFDKDDTKGIERLKQKGVKFQMCSLDYEHMRLKELKEKSVKKTNRNILLEKGIGQINAKYGTKNKSKVKPGYKKKRQKEIEHLKWFLSTRKHINKQSKKK